jgi:glyoxylase-like metal-dependent hydrolase (beta-lactamase superfamily II)
MRSFKLLMAMLLMGISGPAATQLVPSPAMQMWRLDCGDFVMKRYGAWFSDTFQYPAGSKKLVASCYLIRHGNDYMLWDLGLDAGLIANPIDNAEQSMSLKRTIVDQLAAVGIKPEQIGTIGISHDHADHTGQAARFTNAKLLIGKGDWDHLKAAAGGDDFLKMAQGHLAHWLSGAGKSEAVVGDKDVFGDGSVIMLALPGHTPGHSALLVRLKSGPVLLSGDQYHFTEQVKNRGVPAFNVDRADTLASHDRFERIAANVKAKVVIQHEPADIAKLPAFPNAAQ